MFRITKHLNKTITFYNFKNNIFREWKELDNNNLKLIFYFNIEDNL